MTRPTCPWCGTSFMPRSDGGKPQRFCSSRCRRALDRALRAWARDQLTEGRVTVAELQRERCPDGRRAARGRPAPLAPKTAILPTRALRPAPLRDRNETSSEA